MSTKQVEVKISGSVHRNKMNRKPQFTYSDIIEGTELQPLAKKIIQKNINRYAEASKDFNPIHIDDSFAQATPLGGTIAHGMLVLAYISQVMTLSFGKSWLNTGKLNVRFKNPARPGDLITITGNIKKIDFDPVDKVVRCDVVCRNQAGETIISGESTVHVAR